MSDTVITPAGRAAFAYVFKPDSKTAKNDDGSARDPKYTLNVLFPPDADLSDLKQVAQEAAKEKWGDDLPKKLKSPFLDASDFDYEGYEEGWTVIRPSTTMRPQVVGPDLGNRARGRPVLLGLLVPRVGTGVRLRHQGQQGRRVRAEQRAEGARRRSVRRPAQARRGGVYLGRHRRQGRRQEGRRFAVRLSAVSGDG